MDSPLWMLLPWAVFALAVAFKFWRITSVFRRVLAGGQASTEQARRSLERIWSRQL